MAAENPQGTDNTPQVGTVNTPQGQTPQEPAWFQHIPQEQRDEAKKGWMMQSEFTKRTQEIADQKKAWDTEKADWSKKQQEWDEFQKQYTPFYQKLQSNWDKISPIIEGRQVPTQPQQGDQQQGNPFENWELLSGQDQARRLADHVNQNVQQTSLAALKQEFNQALAQREQYYQNYLNILTDAFSRKLSNPELDMQQYMKRAFEIQYGKANPMDLAYNDVTSEAQRKKMEEDFYKKGKEDALLEYQNSQQTNGALQNQTIPVFKQKPMSREQVADAARQVAMKKGYAW